jgi:hypothetical protein
MFGRNNKLGRYAIVVPLMAGLILAGCSDDEPKNGNEVETSAAEVNSETSAPTPVASSPSVLLAEQGITLISAPEAPITDGEYYEIARGMNLLYLFGANAPGGIEVSNTLNNIYATTDDLGDPELAGLVNNYRRGDQFAKRDVADKMVPILKSKISKASGIKYVVVDIQGALNLGDYDFDRQGFKINNNLKDSGEVGSTPYNRNAVSYGDVTHYYLSFVNSSDLNIFPMPEDAARKINEYLKQNNEEFRLYGYIHSVAQDKNDSYNRRYVVMKIQKVELSSSGASDSPRQVFGSVDL